jgi:hypothetical protein
MGDKLDRRIEDKRDDLARGRFAFRPKLTATEGELGQQGGATTGRSELSASIVKKFAFASRYKSEKYRVAMRSGS